MWLAGGAAGAAGGDSGTAGAARGGARAAGGDSGTARAMGGADAGAAYLVVERSDGEVLLRLSLASDPVWIVVWNHSVTGIEVRDAYRFEEGSMLLTESHTPAFDAGLGHIPGRGRLESDGRGGYWIRDIDEPVPGNAYRLRVGSPAVGHRIEHGGRVHSLSDVAAGEPVTIRVEAR